MVKAQEYEKLCSSTLKLNKKILDLISLSCSVINN